MKINSDSPYRDKLSSAILHLQEEGAIQAMYDKWWKQKNIDKFCDNTKTPSTKALELRNVGGVFVLVLTGTFCGFVIALIEFVCNARKISRKGEVRLCINLTRKSKILNFLNVFSVKVLLLCLYVGIRQYPILVSGTCTCTSVWLKIVPGTSFRVPCGLRLSSSCTLL